MPLAQCLSPSTIYLLHADSSFLEVAMYVHHQICLVLTPCLPGSHVAATKLDQHSYSNCITAFLVRTTVMDRLAIANLATASAEFALSTV